MNSNWVAETLTLLNELLINPSSPRAFRGELVPQDPDDEPASLLLERILKEKSYKAAAKESTGKQKGNQVNQEVGGK